jgi:hypothetical protein
VTPVKGREPVAVKTNKIDLSGGSVIGKLTGVAPNKSRKNENVLELVSRWIVYLHGS